MNDDIKYLRSHDIAAQSLNCDRYIFPMNQRQKTDVV